MTRGYIQADVMKLKQYDVTTQSVEFDITRLQAAYRDLPWYTRYFFPAQLRVALEAYSPFEIKPQSFWAIANIFLNHTSFFQRLFISCLREFSRSKLILIAQDTIQRGETENDHFLFDLSFDKQGLVEAKETIRAEINSGGIENKEVQVYYLHALKHPFPSCIRLAVLELNAKNLLLGEEGKYNFDTILVGRGYTAPATARCLIALNGAELLSGDNAQHNRGLLIKSALSGVGFMGKVVNALRTLEQAGIFSGATADSKAQAQVNFKAVIDHPYDPEAVARCIVKLSEAHLLNGEEGQELLNIVSTDADPMRVTDAILKLNDKSATPQQRAFMNYAQLKVDTFFKPYISPVNRGAKRFGVTATSSL